MDAEALARLFHETYEALAPSFGYGHKTREELRRPWSQLPENYRNLMISVCAVVLRDVEREDGMDAIRSYIERTTDQDPQSTAQDRNNWQRRLGVLVTLIETFCQNTIRSLGPSEEDDASSMTRRDDAQWLLDATYRVVNTSPRTGNIDDPYADVAKLTVRHTLQAALEAGLIAPGPLAPEWMRDSE